jgi:hypothetical protein
MRCFGGPAKDFEIRKNKRMRCSWRKKEQKSWRVMDKRSSLLISI